jgi:hypothetical protein
MPLLQTRASGSAIAYGLNANQAYSVVTSGLVLNFDVGNAASYGGQNHLTYSEEFGNSTGWNFGTYGVTVTNNAIAAPDGTTTADLVTGGGTNPTLIYSNALSNIPALYGTGAKRVSVYAKAATSNFFALNCYWDGDTETNVTFNLSNGTIAGDDSNGSTTPTIESAGNGWYLCSYTVPARVGSATGMSWRIWPSGRGSTGTGIYVWGAAQRNVTATPGYIKTIASPANYTSSTWYDTTSSARTLTLNNSPTFTAAGTNNVGSYFRFNGSSHSASSTSMSGLISGLDAASVCLWYRSLGTDNDAMLWDFCNTDGNRDRFSMRQNWAGGQTTGYNSVSNAFGTATVGFSATNVWKHYAFVRRGNVLYGYVDGVLFNTGTTMTAPLLDINKLIIGQDNIGTNFALGDFAIFQTYNRGLTDSEVSQNYNAGRSRYI